MSSGTAGRMNREESEKSLIGIPFEKKLARVVLIKDLSDDPGSNDEKG